MWIERAQSAEAALATCREQQDRLKEQVRAVTGALCAKVKSDGTIDIDFDALVQHLPVEQALELRVAIDQHHRISGAVGEKPRVSVSAA
jgi:hypothetical protein